MRINGDLTSRRRFHATSRVSFHEEFAYFLEQDVNVLTSSAASTSLSIIPDRELAQSTFLERRRLQSLSSISGGTGSTRTGYLRVPNETQPGVFIPERDVAKKVVSRTRCWQC